MKQLILGEETIILTTNDTESIELGEHYFGVFQTSLNVATSDPVKLEYKRKGTNTWLVARQNGEEIKWEAVGDTLTIYLTKHRVYRFKTANSGSEIAIDNH